MNWQQMRAAYMTIVRKEFFRLFRVWVQTLLPPVITTSLYFLVFGKFIGAQVAPIHGVDYMTFIVPGIIMMAVITQSFMHSAFGYYSAKFQKYLEEILVSPTPYWVMILGYVTGGVLRGLVTGALLLGVAFFFTPLHIVSPLHLILFALLSAITFSLAGLINAVFAKDFDSISIFPTFVLTPLTYLAGTFYSLSMLPKIWSDISRWNPLLYMVNGFRFGLIGVTDVSLWSAYVILSLFIVGLTVLLWYLFASGRGVRM
ncbi:MAG: ABC transporter permease [Minisyncoccota bacterium]